jgi:CheY-specific phosphatase CheX
MDPLEVQISTLVETIFQSLEIDPKAVAVHEPGADVVRSRVRLRGPFNGVIAVKCTGPLARTLARRMFVSGDAPVSDEEAQDAVHELANMIAGNLKASLGEAQMSLPAVPANGASGVYRAMGPLATAEIPYAGGLTVVTVLDHDVP